MRILLLCHAFNSLSQRLWVELSRRGHDLSLELDIHDDVTRQALDRFRPDLLLAPYLRRALPEDIWRALPCLIVHPGPAGDRGPSALDWAILNRRSRWGVTVLQAEAALDGGPVWASVDFPLREASKSSLYRQEVSEAACQAVLQALARLEAGASPHYPGDSHWQPLLRQAQRRIDWQQDDGATVLRKIRSADSAPGLRDEILGLPCRLYDAQPEQQLRGPAGTLLAQHQGAVCRATSDGAIWIGQLRAEQPGSLKLPAMQVLGARAADLPEAERPGWQEIEYHEQGKVGYLRFDFPGGAMDTGRCRRLTTAWQQACQRPTRVIVLLGGHDFWSNGMHLHMIEAASSPADASWENIQAIDDLCLAIMQTADQLSIAALRGHAAAGGVFLALAADQVLAREGIVLNPHYRNMGNLYGSEYWTYLLPRRLGAQRAQDLMDRRLPIGAQHALELGLIDACAGPQQDEFARFVENRAQALAAAPDFAARLQHKRERRAQDEAQKPLAAYREAELARMRLNFYGFDPSYHVARHRFVHRSPQAWTPLYLARHRRLDFAPRAPAPEA